MSRYLKNNTSNTKKVRDHPPVVFKSSKVDFEITRMRKRNTHELGCNKHFWKVFGYLRLPLYI